MIQKISVRSVLKMKREMPLIDVRTPSEFGIGHIPGAINLPLFSDEERADVGTLYKRRSKKEAFLRGLEYVGPKMHKLVRTAYQLESQALIVHCWRGGMRSESVGMLLEKAGFDIHLLEGGYKNYRKTVMEDFSKPANLLILGGESGSGKTAILHALSEMGEQIIDLEGIANHKGSAFGGLETKPQPSTEHFQNLLHKRWLETDLQKRVWIEDESFNIGSVVLPEPFWHQKKKASLAVLNMPKAWRVERIVEEYGGLEVETVIQAIKKIKQGLGGQVEKATMQAIREGDLAVVADILLNYYDKSYRRGLAKKKDRIVFHLDCEEKKPDKIAQALTAACQQEMNIN